MLDQVFAAAMECTDMTESRFENSSDIVGDSQIGNDPSSDTLPSEPVKGPLVTFAVFGYNQEKYIREAVESALAQSYEPMEVVLSDDCSTDQTFEIMQEMARSYVGNKIVIARRTHANLGTFLHVVDVANIAKGELLVLAAGDESQEGKEQGRSLLIGSRLVPGVCFPGLIE